jgi:hypothetical protein
MYPQWDSVKKVAVNLLMHESLLIIFVNTVPTSQETHRVYNIKPAS